MPHTVCMVLNILTQYPLRRFQAETQCKIIIPKATEPPNPTREITIRGPAGRRNSVCALLTVVHHSRASG